MDKQVMGTVLRVSRQWWLKINTKAIRFNGMDGAIFPHIIKVRYTVNGQDYLKRKWVSAGKPVPDAGDSIKVLYWDENPQKSMIIW